AAKVSGASSGGSGRTGGSSGGALLAFLPGPKAVLAAGKTTSWCLWAASLVFLVVTLVLGQSLPLVVFSFVHACYCANFSRTDLALQVRLVCLGLALIGGLAQMLRILVCLTLLASTAADLAVGYNIWERVLYLVPANRPENPEDISIDLILRVFMEPPNKKASAFTVKPK
ncbi:unnamed protein product, partial [Polarella glacialis]